MTSKNTKHIDNKDLSESILSSEESSSDEELEFFDDDEDEFILNDYEVDDDEEPIVPQKIVRKYEKKIRKERSKKIRHKYETLYSLRCETCNKVFKHSTSYKKHMSKLHWNVKKHICEICGKESFDSSDAVQHKKSHFTVRNNACRECYKVFPNLQELKEHKAAEHEQFVCEICGKAFITNSTLTKHMEIHNTENPYECDSCDKKYPVRRRLIEHQKLVHLGIRECCFFCLATFTNKRSLSQHLNTTHPNEDHSVLKTPHLYPHICKSCGRRFTAEIMMANHECTPTHNSKFECPDCDKSFLHKRNLDCHREEKHGIQCRIARYSCSQCGLKFVLKSYLDFHKDKEHGIKKKNATYYNCNVCGEDFVFQRLLDAHQLEAHNIHQKRTRKRKSKSLITSGSESEQPSNETISFGFSLHSN